MSPGFVSRRLTTSSTDMRLEGSLCQHPSITDHTRSETSWRCGRGGLAPFSIEYVAAVSCIPKNGGRPVRTCPTSERKDQRRTKESVRTSQAITPKAYISLALVGGVGSVRFGDSTGQVNTGTRLLGSRSALALYSTFRTVEWGRMDALPRPAIRGAPPPSTRMFAWDIGQT